MKKITIGQARPDLAKQLTHPELKDTLGVASKEKVEWRCEYNHTWLAAVSNRVSKNSGCPYCTGKLPIIGENDLATTHPELASQLKDQTLATQIKAGSNKKVEWQCEHGHVWAATINSRVQGANCPYCSNRKTLPGFNDLATTHPDIAAQLTDQSNATKLTAGSHKKVEWCCEHGHTWTTTPQKRVLGQNCPYCSHKNITVGDNDIATTRPDLAKQLVNQNLKTQLHQYSNKQVEWLCPTCHTIYTASPAQRSTNKKVCPNCAQRRAHKGKTDLATLRPDLIPYLKDPTMATHLTEHSNKLIDWVCPTCGYEWQEMVYKRTRSKTKCPACALLKNENPDLAAQMVNQTLAQTIRTGSRKIVQWRCEKGHTWWATVYNRSKQNGTGCPHCSANATSEPEKELAQFIQTLIPRETIITNDKKTLNRLELDIFIPSRNLAFEFNGTYWHDERHVNSTSHQNKRLLCKEKNITLIQIWQDSWVYTRDACESLIKRALNIYSTQQINNQIITTPHKTIQDFIQENSTQPITPSDCCMALTNKQNEILCAIGININNHTIEINSYAEIEPIQNSLKLFIQYIKQQYNPKNITTTVSLDGEQLIFEQNNFILQQEYQPDWSFINERQPERKRNHQNTLNTTLNTSKTGEQLHQLALNNKIFRIYNSGQATYILQ